jgi:hypothetical protein
MKSYGKQLNQETVEAATNKLKALEGRLAKLEYTVHGRWYCIWAAFFDEPRVYVGEIKVFKLNEYDWVAACQMEEAIEWYLTMFDSEWDEVIDDDRHECPLTETMKVEKEGGSGCWWIDGVDVTFKERIRWHQKQGHKFPMVISSTEY